MPIEQPLVVVNCEAAQGSEEDQRVLNACVVTRFMRCEECMSCPIRITLTQECRKKAPATQGGYDEC
jgi:hypothetical protein